MAKLVCGVGFNDSDVVTKCDPFYSRWKGMLVRCYSAKYHAKRPTYIGCTVCDEWLTFSNFKSWMEKQDWKGKELDKDILVIGNKLYSPELCVFVTKLTNSFILDRASSRGSYPLGVYFDKKEGKIRAICKNPFSGKCEHLGYFSCPDGSLV